MNTSWPRTISIPAVAYRFALDQFLIEAWNEQDVDRLADAPAPPDDGETRRATRLLLGRLARCRWTRRRTVLKNVDAGLQRYAALWLIDFSGRAPTCGFVRVSPRRFSAWLWGLPAAAATPNDEQTSAWCDLLHAPSYFEWIERGGCPEAGRYLALWVSMIDS